MEIVTARLGGGNAGEMMGDEEGVEEGEGNGEESDGGDPDSPDSPKKNREK